MSTISTDELADLLAQERPVILIMAMGEAAFARGHIPGSIPLGDKRDLAGHIDREATVIVYCTGPDCAASSIAYRQMRAAGYQNVRHYSGGLQQWAAQGQKIEIGPHINHTMEDHK